MRRETIYIYPFLHSAHSIYVATSYTTSHHPNSPPSTPSTLLSLHPSSLYSILFIYRNFILSAPPFSPLNPVSIIRLNPPILSDSILLVLSGSILEIYFHPPHYMSLLTLISSLLLISLNILVAFISSSHLLSPHDRSGTCDALLKEEHATKHLLQVVN